MSNAKYKYFRSKIPSGAGRFHVRPELIEEHALTELLNADIEMEKYFLPVAIDILENRMFLKKSKTAVGTIETIQIYESADGSLVEIVKDQFKGLMVETSDELLLDRFYRMLLEK